MESTYNRIPTHQIAFDRENPRIKVALEKYGNKLDGLQLPNEASPISVPAHAADTLRSAFDAIANELPPDDALQMIETILRRLADEQPSSDVHEEPSPHDSTR